MSTWTTWTGPIGRPSSLEVGGSLPETFPRELREPRSCLVRRPSGFAAQPSPAWGPPVRAPCAGDLSAYASWRVGTVRARYVGVTTRRGGELPRARARAGSVGAVADPLLGHPGQAGPPPNRARGREAVDRRGTAGGRASRGHRSAAAARLTVYSVHLGAAATEQRDALPPEALNAFAELQVVPETAARDSAP